MKQICDLDIKAMVQLGDSAEKIKVHFGQASPDDMASSVKGCDF